MMKTEDRSEGNATWTNIELLPREECLPIIGNGPVSSILQDFNTNDQDHQNMNLIILPADDSKFNRENSFNLRNDYILLKEDENIMNNVNITVINVEKVGCDVNRKLDDMLYFACNLCPFLCIKDSKITQHMEVAHKHKTIIKLPELKCPACINIFYHRMSLRSHLLHDHGVGNSDLNQIIQAVIYYSNKNNGKKEKVETDFKNEHDVATTKKMVVMGNNYRNNIPNNTNNSSNPVLNDTVLLEKDTKAMMTKVSQINIVQKQFFGTLVKRSNQVTLHEDSNGSNKCIIPNCKIRLQDVDKMKYHINCHIDGGFKCNECGDKFSFWKSLISHLWRLHRIDMGLYSCDKCEYKSCSLAKLNNIHKLIHSEVRAYMCDVCNKSFKNSKQLRNHKVTHKQATEKILQICEVCSKNFTDKRQLKIHMDIVHKKVRPYLCNFCGYKGSSRSSLKMHIRQHTGEKPFSCSSCSYTTSDHNSLRRHKLRHTGQKPYKCRYCSYGCIQSSTYKTHLKTKHPGMEKDLMFTCHECQFRSVNKDIFTFHLITVHNMKLPLNS